MTFNNKPRPKSFFHNSLDRWIAEQLDSCDFSEMIDYFDSCDLDQLEIIGRHLKVMKHSFNKRLAHLEKERKMRGV